MEVKLQSLDQWSLRISLVRNAAWICCLRELCERREWGSWHDPYLNCHSNLRGARPNGWLAYRWCQHQPAELCAGKTRFKNGIVPKRERIHFAGERAAKTQDQHKTSLQNIKENFLWKTLS